MERTTFVDHLKQATGMVLPFSRQFITNHLPDGILYLVSPNRSYDGNPLIGDEQVFPNEAPADSPMRLDADEVVDFLYRGGKVPEWINLTVDSVDERHTYLRLDCCGRFTADDGLLYHEREGYPPFHCLGPALPPGWQNIEQSGRFDLYWLRQRSEGP